MLVTPSARTRRGRADRVEPLDQDPGGGRGGHHAEPGVQPVDVEQRQHEQHHVVLAHRGGLEGLALLEVRQQRPMGEHRRPRPAAGAGGEHQHREVLAAAVSGGRSRAAPGGGHRVQAGRVDVHPVAARHGLLHHGEGGVVAEHDLDVGLGEQPCGLRRGVADVQRHRHQTGPQRREVRRDESRRVRHREGHPVAFVQAEGSAQAGRGGVHVRVEGRPGRRGPGTDGGQVHEGDAARPAGRCRPHQVRDVGHCRSLAQRSP